MCTSTIKLYTTSRFIHQIKPEQFVQDCSCGKCADCIRKTRSQWMLRSYYEAKDCFSKSPNSFVLFDTLTYSDDNLRYFHDVYPPALYNYWDFMAFSRSDVRNFFKRLRSNLMRGCRVDTSKFHKFGFYGKDRIIDLPAFPASKDNLRYFLTSEYGTSDGCTHRPHYHILFFVSFSIDPVVLSLFIAHSWQLGRTDGVPFKSRNYVNIQRVIRSSIPDNMKLINYVSKYVGKDMYFHKKLLRRCYISFSISNPNWQESYSGRLAFRRFKGQVLPFHVQSLGFGAAALRFEDSKYINEYGAIRMPVSNKGVVASVPLSTYFKRKLYYDAVWCLGRLTWILKDSAINVKIDRLQKSVRSFSHRLFSWDCGLGQDLCNKLAVYNLLWRGSLIPSDFVHLSDLEFAKRKFSPIRDFYSISQKSGFVVFSKPLFFNQGTEYDSFHFGRYISDKPQSSLFKGNQICNTWSHSEFMASPPDGFLVVSSDTMSRFQGYDDILNAFQYDMEKEGLIDNYEMLQSDEQRSRYVQLGFLSN